jgi:energy-coupling factor transporter ATP-binding protein EcfA2
MADLHQKLATLQGLLPSQRQYLERLVFQLEFNPYQLIYLVGGPGSGKSTLTLAIADLLSDEFNLALLTVEPELSAGKIRQHLLEQWFGHGVVTDKPLLSLIGERESRQPLALILDQADYLPQELWAELADVPCLVIAAAEQADAHAELNLPLAPVTMEDAEMLLADSAFSTLTIAERLAQAQGNLHVLLNPQLAAKAARPTQTTVQTASVAGPLWVFTIGMALIVGVVVFWFWTERQLQQGTGIGTLTYLPEEQEVATVVANVKEAPPPPPAEKAVVEQLVNQLEKAERGTAQVKGLEKPVDFTEQNVSTAAAEPTASPANTGAEPTIQQDTVVEPDAGPASQELLTDSAMPTGTAGQGQGEKPGLSQTESEDLAAEISADTTTPTTVLPAEATVEAEMAAETASAAAPKLAVNEPEEDLAAEASKELQTTTAVTTSKPTGGYRYAESELLSLSGTQYALQLVVFSNDSALQSFRQSYSQLQTYTYERSKDGKRQLVVVMAPFADAAAAKQHAAQLPAPLQQGFAKPLSDIHSEISTN